MKKIKFWFNCRFWYSGLYDSIIDNIRLRTEDSEFQYRFFRLKYNQAKKQYEKCKLF